MLSKPTSPTELHFLHPHTGSSSPRQQELYKEESEALSTCWMGTPIPVLGKKQKAWIQVKDYVLVDPA